MSYQALELIQTCYKTKYPYLDLGNCGLNDEAVAAGTPIDAALRQCKHLRTLILSNEWFRWNEIGDHFHTNSVNTGEKNKFTSPPPALESLLGLEQLICSGEFGNLWGISDMQFVARLTNLTILNLCFNKIVELRGLSNLTNLKKLYISDNKIVELKGLGNLTSLTHLEISDNKIAELKGLSKLTNLSILSISSNRIAELKGLDRLSNLTEFYIRSNQISELKGLDNLINLSLFSIGSNQISELKGLDNLYNLTNLYIDDNDISELKGLGNLISLTHLDISDNKIAELKGLSKLTNLSILSIRSNKITELKGLDNLINLNELYISNNQIAELKGLDNLSSLFQFDISNNQIAELKGFDKLNKLTQLEIRNNDISELKGLDNLTKLTQLDISYNDITELKGFDKLTNLSLLLINYNQIVELKGLDNLPNLAQIDISSNQITELKGLDELTNLRQLFISSNKIAELKGLDNLPNLAQIDISSNQITELKGLDNLPNLSQLEINDNKIADLKPLLPFLNRENKALKIVLNDWFTSISKGEISVKGNPLITPPIEIVELGNDAVIRYLKQIEEEGQEQVYEAKMVLAGSGESGKTSLSLRLNNRDCILPKKDDRTKEVEVSDYKFLTTDKHDFTAHIWDFGGQQIVHHFHRLFMNESTLYILVTETSRENDDFDYWLQTIKLFGGESPILFIQNKRNGIPRRLNIQPYKTHFNIKDDLFNINLLTNEGLQEVENAIQYHIQQLPIVQRTIPKSWFKLREALSKRNESYIVYDEFVNICHSCGIKERINIEDAGGFLHNLGNILWYKKNPVLREKIILEKQWGTKALFQLIFNEKINGFQKGYFTLADAQSIWDSEKEYSHHASQLIALMVEFKLAYRQRNKTDAYIIPALLKSEQSRKEFNKPSHIKIIYEYAHLPRGIVNQLTAEMCDKIEDDENTWNEGVWFQYGNTEAKITENRFDKIITIEIAGTQHRELFGAIKNTLDNLHSEYRGIKYELKIPCICATCKISEDKHYFNYQDIINRIEAGKKPTIECVKSTEDVLLLGLLDHLLPEQQITELFEIKESMELHFSKMQKSLEKAHDGISMIKNELSQQNEMIINLIKLSNESKANLNLLLNKIDENISNEKASEALENIIKEMELVKAALPKEIAREWKKLNNKSADDVDIKTKLKLKIPIIPLLLDYETELSTDTKKLANKLRSFIF